MGRAVKGSYDQQLAALRERDPELRIGLFNPFVIATNGDFDAAHTAYRAWLAQPAVGAV